MAALFAAGARVSPDTVDSLTACAGEHGERHLHDPGIVRQILDHGRNPNASLTDCRPLLWYVLRQPCSLTVWTLG